LLVIQPGSISANHLITSELHLDAECRRMLGVAIVEVTGHQSERSLVRRLLLQT